MTQTVLIDTGPLVALLDRNEQYHSRAVKQMPHLRTPFSTCEAVVTEAFHLLRHLPKARASIMEMISDGVLKLPFLLRDKPQAVAALLDCYANVPMSLADACLVRMSELVADCVVLTLDSDFRIYRRHRQQKFPLLMPPER